MPVVTPHELLMAIRTEAYPWGCKITTDLTEILKLNSSDQEEQKVDSDEEWEIQQ
jgi:hypothetical protein